MEHEARMTTPSGIDIVQFIVIWMAGFLCGASIVNLLSRKR